ncbi:MAG: hypothetical protein AAF387_10485 [Pseudomonadota bacterium]
MTLTSGEYDEFINRDARLVHHIAPSDALSTLAKVRFEEAVLTTANPHAVSSSHGTPSCWHSNAQSRMWGTPMLTVRPSSTNIAAAVFVTNYSEIEGLDALSFFAESGDLQHRLVFPTSDLSQALRALVEVPAPTFTRNKTNVVNGDISNELDDARRKWNAKGKSWHFDHIKYGGGTVRNDVLAEIGKPYARPVVVEVLRHWLAYLSIHGIGNSRIVPADDWLHIDSSDIQAVRSDNGFALIHSGLGLIAIDEANIGSCWETRFIDGGITISLIELYGNCGRCIAVFAPRDAGNFANWAEITASLPSTALPR